MDTKKKKKNKKWTKFRHKVVRNIAFCILGPYSLIKYRAKVEKFRDQGDRQYLVLFNHQTPFDQFYVGMAFRGPVYFLATEDIFSLGFISKLLRWAIAPIPIKKQTTDIHAVINCMKVAREGGTIALAPEGNRTYSGKTEHMNPSIAMLAKKLGLPIAIYRLEGGYGTQPRWADSVRLGRMRGYVSQVIEPEVYKDMSYDELFELIRKGLDVNEAVLDFEFHGKGLAEYLERAIYVCPKCGLSRFESHGNIVECKGCGLKAEYLPSKELRGVDGEFPFRFVADWYDYQCNFVNKLDTRELCDAPIWRESASISEVIVYKKKRPISDVAEVELWGDRVVVRTPEEEFNFDFETVSAAAVLGRNKLNIYYGDKVYQLKGDERFNALKFVNLYYRHKNIIEGAENEAFLGL